MKPQAVVFDLDGTLLDSIEDLAGSMNRVLESQGFPVHPVRSYLHFIGDGASMLAQRALPEQERSVTQIDSLHAAFELDYRKNWNHHTGLYPGIADMLNLLTDRGSKLAVLSNKPHEFTLLNAEHFLSQWHFEAVFGQRREVPKKPDPASVFEIAEQMKIYPQHILFIGDSGVDMRTARSAGCYAVGATWGFRPRKELLDAGAHSLISHPVELLSLLDSLEL